MSNYFPPVIIIGMHRSGTSLLARMLHECGVFMGAKRNGHGEAFFFLKRNRQIFHLAHADWDNPEPVRYLLDCQEIRAELTASLRADMTSFKTIEYLGLTKYSKFRGLMSIVHPWGWKDPQNSYTLPIWLDIFDAAKVIRIYRNGVDVVYSLWKREQKRPNRLANPLLSCRCMSLEEAFALWAEYEYMNLSVTENLPDDRVLHLKYENLLANPLDHLDRIVRFLQISFDPMTRDRLVRDIHPDRAYAFLRNEELMRFYEKNRNHPLMERFGYQSFPEASESKG
jgi:hypothetical protein